VSVDPAGDSSGSVAMASPPTAEVIAVTMSFGATRALDDVTLTVHNGASHALVGRNGAGKSTLVGVLTGLLEPDHGSVRLDGQPAPSIGERERWRQEVACVYQRSTVIPSLSVAENLFLNAYPNPDRPFLSWKEIRSQARELIDEWGIGTHVDTPASDLTVGQRQLVEIARALRVGTRFIILDEPTAQLEAREIEELFDHIGRMQAKGATFLYISHHLDEVYEVCREVTVLRDGRRIVTSDVDHMSKDDMVSAMVGPDYVDPAQVSQRKTRESGDRGGLEVRNLDVAGFCTDISFKVGPGESVGLAGLAGSGSTQIAAAIVGLITPDSGEVVVSGHRLTPGRVDRAIASGIGYVPGDRHAEGFSPNLSVEENLTTTVLYELGRFGLVEPGRRHRMAAELANRTEIVASSLDQLITELSGGNQQKAVMGRALASDPEILVLVHPTAGVDIASTQTLLSTVLSSDLGILIVSDELDELAVCDRVLVVFEGHITAEFRAGWEATDLVSAIEGVQ
jgi:simple sugar transport system ATP-binding protein